MDEPPRPAGPSDAWIATQLAQRKADEKRRQQEQGFGRPLITGEIAGKRIVAIDPHTVIYGDWKTLPDLFLARIKVALGLEWGAAELAKPNAERHPIMQWCESVGQLWKRTTAGTKEIVGAPTTGAVQMYLGLAYNLWLLRHDAELSSDLVHKLKTIDHYNGALYEAFIAACFIRAGFKIELEDERDKSLSHHEFTAIHPSGRKYSVECKSRQPGKTEPKVVSKLKDALDKKTDHKRIVCIDVNIANKPGETPEWLLERSYQDIKASESTMRLGKNKPAPEAYVFVTNHPYRYDLEATNITRAMVPIGFKIKDFGHGSAFVTLAEQFYARERHADVEQAFNGIINYKIPSTFDAAVPEFAFGGVERKWVVGTEYDLSEIKPGCSGVLTQGMVSDVEGVAWLTFRLPGGREVIAVDRLSEDALKAYRSHPQTFFGTYQETGGQLTDPLSHFIWFRKVMNGATRERMLQFFARSSELPTLEKLSDAALFDVFCERHAIAVLMKSGKWPPNPSGPRPVE